MSTFRPYDSRGEHRTTRRHLPHWQQPGATYFVTFRLADSLPREVFDRFAEIRRLNGDRDEAFACIDQKLDAGSGSCALAKPANAEIVAGALRYFDGQKYALGGFVVMPNHVHVIVQPHEGVDLSRLLHSWKSFTAHELQRHAGIQNAVWQDESFNRIVRNEAELLRFHEYIAANPRMAGLQEGTYALGQGKWEFVHVKNVTGTEACPTKPLSENQ